MLALWMLYATLVGALVMGAAWALERAVDRRRRWLWGGAIGLGAVAPVLVPFLREALSAPSGLEMTFGPASPVVGGALSELAVPAAASQVGWSPDAVLAGAWIGASCVILATVVVGLVRLGRMSRSWSRRVVDGVPVLVSRDVGPAVIGVRTPEVVVPEWVLELPDAERALVLAHEDEHRRRYDPSLLALALVAPVAMPWNAALWWGFLRLREAVETDCDRRVLARRPGGAVSYARLLVDVGARTIGQVPLGAGFGERSSSLERRVRLMLDRASDLDWRGLGIRAALAVTLVVAACSLEVNVNLDEPEEETPAEFSAVEVPATADESAGAAEFQATEGPASEALERRLDELERRIEEEAAARRAAEEETRRAPPPVPEPDDPDLSVDERVAERARVEDDGDQDLSGGPTFTPFTVAPSIQNRREVIAAMEAEYPPLLRQAGIGGTVRMYFFIDEEGRVQDMRIDKSSGHVPLDDAALRVADVYRFSPALNRDQKVPVWVSFPITFQTALREGGSAGNG